MTESHPRRLSAAASATPGATPRGGFTLVEVIISVGIVASIALSILALLAFAGDSVGDLKSASAARRASGVARQWIEQSDFATLYNEMRTDREIILVSYEYRAEDGERPDGTPPPETDHENTDTATTVPVIRRRDAPEVGEDLEAVQGPAFLCRITLLSLVGESAPDLPELDNYELAALPLRVEFFRTPPVLELVQSDVPRRRPAFSFQTHANR